VLVGSGSESKATLNTDKAFGATAARKAASVRAKSLVLVPAPSEQAAAGRVEAMLTGVRLSGYRFDRYRTKDQKDVPPKLADVTIALKAAKDFPAAEERSKRLAHAVSFARDLINEPANVIYPESFAKEARRVAKENGLEITVLEPKDLEKEKFGMLLAVGRGSAHTPRVVHLVYKPKKKSGKRIALIGKGVTFDSGGLSLKPAGSMEDMKIDMSGGAAVLGAMSVLGAFDIEHEVHGFVGLVENMPSSNSYRPGDVIISRKGTSVEVNNTDAEGRLVLGDVIDYCKTTIDPHAMIDLATLTGACMVALGPTTAGLFSNSDVLATAISESAKLVGEDFWRLPLNDALKEQLRSDVADMKNTGDRMGGAITGALFLKEFAGDTPWAHLDIAGPASSSKDKGILTKGGVGFGIATLIATLLRDDLPGAPKADKKSAKKAKA
jgi:leucyl aminopeptidase